VTVTIISSSAIRLSSVISPSSSRIWVRRSSPYCSLMAVSSSTMTPISRPSSARMASSRSVVAHRSRYSVSSFSRSRPGEPGEPHVEDGLRLPIRQPVGAPFARRLDLGGRPAGALEEAVEPVHRLVHEAALGLLGLVRAADDGDDPVDGGDRQAEALDDLAPEARLVEVPQGAAGDHVAPVLDEAQQRRAQVEDLGPPVDDRQHVDAVRRLQRGHLVQVVEHDGGHGVALELEDHADAGAGRSRRGCR
jgi:hypothetical protein